MAGTPVTDRSVLQRELQAIVDSDTYKPLNVKSIGVTFADGTTMNASPKPPPPPPAPPPPTRQVIQQAAGAWYRDVGGDASCELQDVLLQQGGLVHFVSSGDLTVRRCGSNGAPSGKGMYFIIVATGGARRVLIDNTGVTGWWITHGNEAAIRIMGDADTVEIANLDLVGRMHHTDDKGVDDPNKTKLLAPPTWDRGIVTHPANLGSGIDWWKQTIQWRALSEGIWRGGRCIGRWDVGDQAAPLQKQVVHHLLVTGVGLTDEPHFTHPESYGLVERKDCYVIDMQGRPVKKGGLLVRWNDRQFHGKAA